MSDALFRIVYVSRSRIAAAVGEEEVAGILDASRRNNAAVGVTGALLFCRDCFAQVLEGPLDAVSVVFERIQGDPRHAEVVVLEAAPVAARGFADWSMAYAGRRTDADANFAALTGSEDGGRVVALLRGHVLRTEDLAA